MENENNSNNKNSNNGFNFNIVEEILKYLKLGINKPFTLVKKVIKAMASFFMEHSIVKKILLVVAIAGIFAIIVGVCYYIVILDGTEDSESSSNVPNGVSSYTSSLTTGETGELFESSTIQELWDELVENGSDIGNYLDSAEDLATLVNAELITQNVDTREDPDEEIDWDEVIEEMTYGSDESDEEDSDDTEEDNLTSVQGIIKFKRATANDNGTDYDTETMSYVDYDTFYDWIEIYSEEGDTKVEYNGKRVSVLDCLKTHFTLESEETSSSSSSSSSASRYTETLTYSINDIWTDISAQIVKAAFQVSSPGSGLCQKWVRLVYNQAGLGNVSYYTAYDAYKANVVSTDTDNIPVGAAVYGTGSGSYAGHVGIYLGDIDSDGVGEVIENINGAIEINDLDYWISWQENRSTVHSEGAGWLGWGWQAGEPSYILNEEETIEAIASIEGSYTNGTIVASKYKYNTDGSSSDNSTRNTSSDVTTSDTSEESADESTENSTNIYAIVATWNKVKHTETTNDNERQSEADANGYTSYTVSTTKVDYKELTSGYTMPFNYLWEYLVVTHNQDFVMALADLVYESEIEITVYDTETITTNTETINYDIEKETVTTVDSIKYNYNSYYTVQNEKVPYFSGEFSITEIDLIEDSEHTSDSTSNKINCTYTTIEEGKYYTKTTVTTTNTLNVELTKADVWMADYEVEISDVSTSENTQESDPEGLDDEVVDTQVFQDSALFEYGQKNIKYIKEKANEIANGYSYRQELGIPTTIEDDEGNTYDVEYEATYDSMEGVRHNYTETHVNRTSTTTTKTETTEITLSPMTVTEKTDKDSEEPNFVTIFIEYQGARSAVFECWSWLMKIMEANEDTVDLIDLTKYLVYKATGKDYGVTEYDFDSLYETTYENLTSVGAGDYIVNTEMSDSSIVLTEDQYITALSGWGGDTSKLLAQASLFIELQEEYKVNAVFAAAVAIQESGGGTSNRATDYRHDWFGITGSSKTYDSVEENIKYWFWMISSGDIYFTQGRYTVSDIAEKYNENPDNWTEKITTLMTNMFNAAGITITSSTEANITTENGDGYTQTITINGRTYKEYKQASGSYAGVAYSEGTISSSGCGPTSAAIVASGYGSDYNPGTLVNAARKKYGVSNFQANATSTGKMLTTAGLTFTQDYSLSKADLVAHLETGRPAVLSVDSSCGAIFTNNTHYIAVLGINGDQVYVSNPNTKKTTGWVDIDTVVTCNSSTERCALLVLDY